MSLLETQNFLARLYTDENLRREFVVAPEKIGSENNLKPGEIAELAKILPEELNSFSESLFYKRLREVEKLLPLMRKILKKDFERHFREFANIFLPESNKKHFEDAINFADSLANQENEFVWLKDIARFEKTRSEFNVLQKRFSMILLDYDVRLILENTSNEKSDLFTNLKKRKTAVIWLRFGNKVNHFVI